MDYERFFLNSMKDQCKKYVALHLRSYISIPQYWPGVSCTYMLATFKLPHNTSHIKSLTFTSALIIYIMTLYFMCTYSIYSLKTFKGKFCEVNLKTIQNLFVIFFFFFSIPH